MKVSYGFQLFNHLAEDACGLLVQVRALDDSDSGLLREVDPAWHSPVAACQIELERELVDQELDKARLLLVGNDDL